MVDKLEACAFCRSDDLAFTQPCSGGGWSVLCRACHTTMDVRSETQDGAVVAWNRRTPADGEQVERIADALKAAAEAFDDPVGLYVKGEYLRRFERDNPNASSEEWDAAMEASEDESWRILARAAAATLSTPTEDARSRVKVLEEALEPFAKAGELFDREPIDPRYVVVIYGPAAGEDYRITDRHLRTARTALRARAAQHDREVG